MSQVSWKKNEPSATATNGSVCPRTTLAAVESLAIPLVQEVVFLADYRCSQCQERVAEIMNKMSGELSSALDNLCGFNGSLVQPLQPIATTGNGGDCGVRGGGGGRGDL